MWTLLITLFVIICETVSETKLCDFEKSVVLTNHTYAGVTFGSNETFIDSKTKQERGCLCLKGTCARKCCPFGQAYEAVDGVCVNVTDKFDPPVRANRNNGFKVEEGFNATTKFIFMIGKMICVKEAGEKRLPVYPAADTYSLMTDGNLYVEFRNSVPNVSIYGPDKYCIDTFLSKKKGLQLNAFICFIPEPEHNNYETSSSFMLISCFFILLTVAVYAWLPELRNLHGMVLMAYLLSFFVGFLFLAIMQILSLMKQIPQQVCTVLTFIIYFSLLAAFFWLNVMSYDIWWTFSGKRAQGRLGSQKKRFMYYAIYAFSVPTALTIILAALEFSDLPMKHPLLPNLRLQACFLYGNSRLLYLYGPIMILCVANIIFFILTAFKIWKTKKETAMLRDKESSTHDKDRNERFTLYIKLSAIMGINWIMEVISSFYPDAEFFWLFFDAYNVLVGLVIFLIFVCKPKTWKMIKKRIRDFRRTNSTTREMNINRVRNNQIPRWQTKEDSSRTDGPETIKTTVDIEGDSRNSRSENESNQPLSSLRNIRLLKTVNSIMINRGTESNHQNPGIYDVSGQEFLIKTDKAGNFKSKDIEQISLGADLSCTE